MHNNIIFGDRIIHYIRCSAMGGMPKSSANLASVQSRLQGWQASLLAQLQRQHEEMRSYARECGLRCDFAAGEISLAFKLIAQRLSGGIDLFHLHSGRAMIATKDWRTRWFLGRKIPIVISLHGSNGKAKPKSRVRQHVDLSRFFSSIIVPGEHQRAWHIECGVNPDQIFVVPDVILPGVSTERKGNLRKRLGLSSETVIILFCGRLTDTKGVLEAMRAFETIAPSYRHVAMVVAGTGPLMAECNKKAAEMMKRIFLLGHCSDVRELYEDADMFVSPSRNESFGMAAFEAALHGKPMVLGRIEPWATSFSDDSCIFVNPTEADEIAQAFKSLIKDPQLRQKLGENGKRIALECCSPTKALAACNKAYAYAWQR